MYFTDRTNPNKYVNDDNLIQICPDGSFVTPDRRECISATELFTNSAQRIRSGMDGTKYLERVTYREDIRGILVTGAILCQGNSALPSIYPNNEVNDVYINNILSTLTSPNGLINDISQTGCIDLANGEIINNDLSKTNCFLTAQIPNEAKTFAYNAKRMLTQKILPDGSCSCYNLPNYHVFRPPTAEEVSAEGYDPAPYDCRREGKLPNADGRTCDSCPDGQELIRPVKTTPVQIPPETMFMT